MSELSHLPRALSESDMSPEVQADTKPRIVIFGTNFGGARELKGHLDTFLKTQELPELGVQVGRYVESITDTFYGRTDDEPDAVHLPYGVIMQPEMRECSTGSNATIPTPVGEIAELCAANDVPFMLLPSDSSYELAASTLLGQRALLQE